MLDEYTKRNNERFISVLKKQEGDLFNTFIEFYLIMLKNFQDKEVRNFFRHAFLNMNYKVENTITQNVTEEKYNKQFVEILSLVNTNKLNITDEKEVFHVIKIIKAVTVQNLIQVFAKDLPNDDSIRNYTFEINLLKKGLYKEGQEE